MARQTTPAAPAITPAVIRTTRTRLGLTQREFGRRLGCSESRVCHLERGTATATGPLRRLLQCAVAELPPQKLPA
jgi:DNA-binding transcriptional regulator YiaG